MKLKDYISGKREGKEANRLEQDALNNPFLHEAIDGYDSFDGNHLPTLESLEKELDKRISKKQNGRFLSRKMLWMAASVALLIGVGSFFMVWNSGTDKRLIASNDLLEKNDSSIVNEQEHLPVIMDVEEDAVQTIIQDEVVSTPLIADYGLIPGDKQSEKKKTSSDSYFAVEQQAEIVNDDPVLMSEIQDEIELDSLIPDNRIEGYMADTYTSKEKMNKSFLSVTKRAAPIQDKSGKPVAEILVEGTALDESGEPLIGVNVHVEGTTIGAITDLDGYFKLFVPSDLSSHKLMTSYIGYEPQEFTLPADNELAYVYLKPSVSALEEVVVIGYGVQKKSSITGSVSQVDKNKEFGEKEFRVYLVRNINTDLCEEKVVKVSLKFYLDDTGKPTNIEVGSGDCEALRDEIIYWVENTPKWSQQNKHVKLRLKLRF